MLTAELSADCQHGPTCLDEFVSYGTHRSRTLQGHSCGRCTKAEERRLGFNDVLNNLGPRGSTRNDLAYSAEGPICLVQLLRSSA